MLNPTGPERFRAALSAAGVAGEIVELPVSARTAGEAAAALGCTVAEIAKSLVFRRAEGSEPVLVVMSGSNRASQARVEAALGTAIGKADATFVRARTGYAIGGVPPFGHLRSLPALLDEDLFGFDVVWAAAGGPHHVFPIAPAVLQRVTGGRRLALRE